ncbi:DMT family transporter [Neptunicoccus cionae]|uniref:Membrane protein n=1 Tax=Neptunicoccus cionae TaxID=2035344 RepID=A0A916R4F2_9RHOB|nr:DMT family transporter [Amylibacter cionae]GGA30163.1 membrane protein [Amylibacter cionae]
MKLSDNMQGAALMTASMAGFALNDAALKFGGSDMGLFQAIFIRGIFAVLLIGGFAFMRGALSALPAKRDLRWISIRSLAEIGATLCFLTALFHMPLANVTAILQVLPLTITLAAVVFLGEPIGGKRILAILAGFLGVLIIIRPGTSDFNAYALLGLLAVGFVTLRDLSARQLSVKVSSLFVAFVAACVITLAGAVGVFVSQSWTPVDPTELGILALAACFLFVGYYCSVATMRVGEVAVVTPFRYSILLWAIALGWLLFGDIPDGWSILGMAIIFGSGVFTMWRERKVKRAAERTTKQRETAVKAGLASDMPPVNLR